MSITLHAKSLVAAKAIIILLMVLGPVSKMQALDANLIYYFTHCDSRDGLSENCVKSITQDRWGFIWLGTKNGLNRYDGRSLKHYLIGEERGSHANQNVSALCEDRNGQLWVGTDKGVFIFNPGNETFRFFDMAAQDDKTITNWIAQIAIDGHQCVWIVSPDEGIFRFDPAKQRLQHYNTRRNNDDQTFNPQSLCLRPNGDVWVGTAGQGLFLLDEATGHMKQVLGELAGQDIYTMENYGDEILFGEHEGRLMKFNPRTYEMKAVDSPNVHFKIIRDIDVDGDNIFVATQDGLYIVNEALHSEQRLHENGFMPNTLSDNMIYTLYRDRERGLWIGTMQSGVNYMPPRGLHFFCYVPTGRTGSLSQKHVREMQVDAQGLVWIANEVGEINIFNPATQMFETLNTPRYKGGTNRLALLAVGEYMWSGLFKNGLDVISVATRQITHYSPEDLGLQKEGSVYALCSDGNGNVWLGTGAGLYVQSGGMHFNKVTSIPDVFVQDIMETPDGSIWLTTIGSGVLCYNPRTKRSQTFSVASGHLRSNDVSSMTVDHRGHLWFATDRGGITTCNPQTGEWKTFGRENGLPDDVTYKVLEDSLGRLWFGTNHGLCCGRMADAHLVVYENSNGLPGNQYNYKSAVVGRDGMFYFGGTQGLVAFNPMLAGKNPQGKVIITNVRVNHADVHPEKNGILECNVIEAREIRLPYDFSSLEIDVSSLDYTGMESDSYEYQLFGMDKGWTLVRENEISFSRLQPGTYTLRVRPGGGKEVTELKVIVRNPWWLTWPMKLLYVLLLAGFAWYAYQQVQSRQSERMLVREQHFREEQEKELLQAKINFFTDITHEIRTPLTLIYGAVENIMARNESDFLGKNLTAISKNTKRLLNLINQLLDFRKVDSNSVRLSFTNVRLQPLLESIVERFEPAVVLQKKTISLDMEDEDVVLQADREALTKIISNLLNNARKYSESFVQMHVGEPVGDRLAIHVVNDGQKIPANMVEEIFKPFTQLDSSHSQAGSGLGLPMARSLAELHGGTLAMDVASEYNEFVLTLPLKQAHVVDVSSSGERLSESSAPVVSEHFAEEYVPSGKGLKEYTILVVEDNKEVLDLIADGMSQHYNLLTANNGEEGLRLAHKEHVDLVVSDVMMPVMDGLEMCRLMKEDIETSHIPVVMLTAKQTLDNRIEGLRAGADAYIEKPFSFAHLLTQVETLLANRKRERESFVKKPYLSVQNAGISKVEEQFISRITELITKNIRQPEFNVEQLASEMCMSRSSLHRKIREVSDMTPIDFIRLIRLKKAAELIRQHGYRANEVCEMVGIASPSYFIKLFQRQFGMTPKEFATEGKNG